MMCTYSELDLHLACLWIWCSKLSILLEMSLWSFVRWLILCLSILTAVMSMSFRGKPCSTIFLKSSNLSTNKNPQHNVQQLPLTSLSTKFPDKPGPPGTVSLAVLSWISASIVSLLFMRFFISSFRDAIDIESILPTQQVSDLSEIFFSLGQHSCTSKSASLLSQHQALRCTWQSWSQSYQILSIT